MFTKNVASKPRNFLITPSIRDRVSQRTQGTTIDKTSPPNKEFVKTLRNCHKKCKIDKKKRERKEEIIWMVHGNRTKKT